MDDTLQVWPYSDIIARLNIPAEIVQTIGPLDKNDLLYYASYTSYRTKIPLTDVSETGLVLYLIAHPIFCIEIFTQKRPLQLHCKLSLESNYDCILGHPIPIDIRRLYMSNVFPIVSDGRTEYELCYLRVLGMNSRYDQVLYDLLENSRSGQMYLDLDALKLIDQPGTHRYKHHKYRICGSNQKLYDAVLIVINKFRTLKRSSIPKARRDQLWIKHFGTSYSGQCLICEKEFTIVDNWEAGHVVPSSKGGSDNLDNLRPICRDCNRSMGCTNMITWAKHHYPNNKIDTLPSNPTTIPSNHIITPSNPIITPSNIIIIPSNPNTIAPTIQHFILRSLNASDRDIESLLNIYLTSHENNMLRDFLHSQVLNFIPITNSLFYEECTGSVFENSTFTGIITTSFRDALFGISAPYHHTILSSVRDFLRSKLQVTNMNPYLSNISWDRTNTYSMFVFQNRLDYADFRAKLPPQITIEAIFSLDLNKLLTGKDVEILAGWFEVPRRGTKNNMLTAIKNKL
jgi:hypothetical protein